MAWTLSLPCATAAARLAIPNDGVRPPSIRLEHNSTRAAPASIAARTPATLSMQISKIGMRYPLDVFDRHYAGNRLQRAGDRRGDGEPAGQFDLDFALRGTEHHHQRHFAFALGAQPLLDRGQRRLVAQENPQALMNARGRQRQSL